jgi:hypothetical protein
MRPNETNVADDVDDAVLYSLTKYSAIFAKVNAPPMLD